jgi:2-oxoglutarate ferredoxin oxidoreductase subunit alpha
LLLRARYLVDVDCWSEASGQPLNPGKVERILRASLEAAGVSQ